MSDSQTTPVISQYIIPCCMYHHGTAHFCSSSNSNEHAVHVSKVFQYIGRCIHGLDAGAFTCSSQFLGQCMVLTRHFIFIQKGETSPRLSYLFSLFPSFDFDLSFSHTVWQCRIKVISTIQGGNFRSTLSGKSTVSCIMSL